MPRVIVFDVNETLLDLRALDDDFERVFGDRRAREEWFQQLLQSAFVATITNAYADFGTVGRAALAMVAAKRERTVPEDDARRILAGMRELPPHPEVRAALARLREAGLRLAALTNSTEPVARQQLENADLSTYFEKILSADSVRRLKPAPEPYRMAARELGVEVVQVRLVAAHAWDIAGALRAGCAAAFVQRPGRVLDPLVEPPDVVGRDLTEVAQAILQREAGRVPR